MSLSLPSNVDVNKNCTKQDSFDTSHDKSVPPVLSMSSNLIVSRNEDQQDWNRQDTKVTYQDVYTSWSARTPSERAELQTNVTNDRLDGIGRKPCESKPVQNQNRDLNKPISTASTRPAVTAVDNTFVDSHWTREKSIYNCNVCNKRNYNRLDKIRDHIRAHLSIKPYTCSNGNCKKAYTTAYLLNDHVKRTHKPPTFRCSECYKTFARASYLKQHANCHTNVRPYACGQCEKRFHTNTDLNTHTRIGHRKPKNDTQCEICGYVSTRDCMRRHVDSVHLKKRYECEVCGVGFARLYQLREHGRAHGLGDVLTCDICSITFTRRSGLIRHVRTHSAPSLPCPQCDKTFRTQSFLEGHLRKHEGVRKYYCKTCGKRFTHAHYLSSHVKSHGLKEFVCEICGAKFSRKDNLKTHVLRHETSGRLKLKKTVA